MAVVHMRIEKFGQIVKINDDHPLAVAQLREHPRTQVYHDRPSEDVILASKAQAEGAAAEKPKGKKGKAAEAQAEGAAE